MFKKAISFILITFIIVTASENIAHADSVIVEVEDEKTIDAIKKSIPKLTITHYYDTLFHGISATGDQADIEKLSNITGVKQVMRSVSYKVSLEDSVPFIGGDAVRDLFRKQKLTGKGVKVGVIDTGVDYTHPDLEKNFRGGYDVVDEDADPMETKAHQGEPTLHGTHVAGIIGANGKLKGVAPEAEIYGYRTLGPGGFGTSEQVIAAIEKAVEDGMDVINLSLGNSVNGPDWPTSLALNKAVEKGVVCVTSSGNSGPNLWTVGSPGTASNAISVGASSPPLKIPFIKASLTDEKLPIFPMQGTIPWDNHFVVHDYEIIDGGLGRLEEIKDADNKIVLIERGKITFSEKAIHARAKGARAVLIYNNEEGMFSGSLLAQLDIPVYSISKTAGHFLKDQMKNRKTYIETEMDKMQDKIAAFSSRGPVTHTWEIKPDVSAPGVAIDSTVPEGYMALQGTSMAAPHVAGAAALVKQAHPEWNPEQIKAALMNTSIRLKDEQGNLYLPFEQGAGRIQVDDAVEAETLIYPGAFSFGKIEKNNTRTERTLKFTIDNQSKETKVYKFEYPKTKRGIQWKIPMTTTVAPKTKKQISIAIDIQPSRTKEGIHQDYLVLRDKGKPIYLPYLFVIGNTNYPRVMGFDFSLEENETEYKYEFYLPEGAEEVGITLYEPETLRYIGMLYYSKDVKRGITEVVIDKDKIGFPEGQYKAFVFAKKDEQEDRIETNILIGKSPLNGHKIRTDFIVK